MSQDVTIRMPDGTTRQISDTHEPKTSSVTIPDGKMIELVEWVPKGEGLEKARHDSASWDELSADLAFECKYGHFNCSTVKGGPCDDEGARTPAAARLAELNAELLSLMRRARELQRANFNLIRLRHDAPAFGRNERELEKIFRQIDGLRVKIEDAELDDDSERGLA